MKDIKLLHVNREDIMDSVGEHVREICREHKEFNFNDLIRILVFQKNNKFHQCVKVGVGDIYTDVGGEEIKVFVEIDRWIQAITDVVGDDDSEYEEKKKVTSLVELSPALHDLHRLGHYDALRRTVRLLLLYKALVAAHFNIQSAKKVRLVSDALLNVARTLLKNKNLREALEYIFSDRLKQEKPKTSIEYDFRISIPLLIVVAIGLSQCEFFRPIMWEAFSAARSREELRSKWPKQYLDDKYLNFISFLILYQTAPGQLARRTGDRRFIAEAQAMVRSGFLPFTTAEPVLKSLNLIGVIHEARNHRLTGYAEPGTNNNREDLSLMTKIIDKFKINEDIHREWTEPTWYKLDCPMPEAIRPDCWKRIKELVYRNPEHLSSDLKRCNIEDGELKELIYSSKVDPIRNAEEIFSQSGGVGEKYTWSYATTLDVEPEDMSLFKEISQNAVLRSNADKANEIVAFSFGRQQSIDLKESLEKFIKRCAKKPADYKECFRSITHAIPKCFAPEKEASEYLAEIFLEDVRASQKVLFGKEQTREKGKEAISSERIKKAADLFLHLYDHAVEIFALDKKGDVAKLSGQDLYMPFPLLNRLLEIVYRFRPEECLSIPITFEDKYHYAIHIPQDPEDKIDKQHIGLIANFVNAWVLNQGMSRGFRKCDIGLGMLGEKWKEHIQEYSTKNGYPVLTEKYLRDYNTERFNIEEVQSRWPSPLSPIQLNDLEISLGKYFKNLNDSGKQRKIFLGIDVGGTLTKMRFYEFNDKQKFTAIHDKFRIKTSGTGGKDYDQQKPEEDFARRIIEKIKSEIPKDFKGDDILAVGLSWPGPVRNNRIAGTSGILKNFAPLKSIILDNKIEDIMKLDLLGAFERQWKDEWKSSPPPLFTLVNDGDADGSGALADFLTDYTGEADTRVATQNPPPVAT